MHTGNTPASPLWFASHSAHPRAYGEYSWVRVHDGERSGSSPCIRGIRWLLACCIARHRLIPVHTGNTPTRGCFSTAPSAHPRAYGEYAAAVMCLPLRTGSSPCIRGIPWKRTISLPVRRLIPVHTGNTLLRFGPAIFNAAHPRAYGEYRCLSDYCARAGGSSPCIRGIHLATRHDTQPKTKKYSVSTRIHI